MDLRSKLRGATRLSSELATSPGVRRSWWLRITRPRNLFQPHNDTFPDRYPGVFSFLQQKLASKGDVRLLSFGCSVGDEVFSLRKYFPEAIIVGIDISRGNVSECRRRCRRMGDPRMRFVRANTTELQPANYYDAVLCMAVLRHGDLGESPTESCAHRITFAAFDEAVRGFTHCLKNGGYLAIEHSNFRFRDSTCASEFDVVDTNGFAMADRATPLFGPDNKRLVDQQYRDVIFRKKT